MWIVSNAVSDILSSVTIMVTYTLTLYHHKFNYNISLFWVAYIGAVTNYTFLGVNIDRTFAIKYPMKAYSKSPVRIWVSILSCWVLALIPSFPYLLDTTLAICAEHCPTCWMPVDNVSMCKQCKQFPHLI